MSWPTKLKDGKYTSKDGRTIIVQGGQAEYAQETPLSAMLNIPRRTAQGPVPRSIEGSGIAFGNAVTSGLAVPVAAGAQTALDAVREKFGGTAKGAGSFAGNLEAKKRMASEATGQNPEMAFAGSVLAPANLLGPGGAVAGAVGHAMSLGQDPVIPALTTGALTFAAPLLKLMGSGPRGQMMKFLLDKFGKRAPEAAPLPPSKPSNLPPPGVDGNLPPEPASFAPRVEPEFQPRSEVRPPSIVRNLPPEQASFSPRVEPEFQPRSEVHAPVDESWLLDNSALGPATSVGPVKTAPGLRALAEDPATNVGPKTSPSLRRVSREPSTETGPLPEPVENTNILPPEPSTGVTATQVRNPGISGSTKIYGEGVPEVSPQFDKTPALPFNQKLLGRAPPEPPYTPPLADTVARPPTPVPPENQILGEKADKLRAEFMAGTGPQAGRPPVEASKSSVPWETGPGTVGGRPSNVTPTPQPPREPWQAPDVEMYWLDRLRSFLPQLAKQGYRGAASEGVNIMRAMEDERVRELARDGGD